MIECSVEILAMQTLWTIFSVSNGWKRDDYNTLSWQIAAAFGCVDSCMMLHWQLSPWMYFAAALP